MNNCKDCAFFVAYPVPADNQFGTCQRRSPFVTGGLHCEVSTVWPEVKETYGCGEWERK